MADKTASFAVKLDTTDVSKGSKSASQDLDETRRKIEEEQKALRDLQSAMGRLKGNSDAVKEAKKSLIDKIKGSKEALGQAQASYIKGGGALDLIGKKAVDAGKGAEKGKEATSLMAKASEALTEKTMGAAGGVGKMAAHLGKLGPYVAAIAAVVLLTVGLSVLAVKMADASRSARLANEAMTGSAEGGAKLSNRLAQLGRTLPIAKDQLKQIAQALTDKGLQGGALEFALSAVARTTAVLGQTAGGKIQAIAEKSKELKKFTAQALDFTGTGIGIDDVATALAKRTKTTMQAARESIKAGSVDLATGLAALDDATKSKLGGAAAKMNNALPAIWERAQAGFGSMFAGLDIEPILQGLSDLVGLIDSSSESGKALRAIAEIALQPLLDFLGPGAGVVSFFENCVIVALVLAIAVVRAKNAISSFGTAAVAALKSVSTSVTDVGSNIIDGLVNGIKAGASKVAKALTSVVDDAVASVRKKLEIGSPSKLMHRYGGWTMEGFGDGVEDEGEKVRGKMSLAIGVPSLKPTGSLGGSRGGASVTIHQLTIQAAPGERIGDPSLTMRVAKMLRDAAIMAGEGPVPA